MKIVLDIQLDLAEAVDFWRDLSPATRIAIMLVLAALLTALVVIEEKIG